ncbi:MAG: c-type cytochrome [Armatimonadetes bacterium]|nr:c-type cytochrome [Armatimonadota bacterium]
MAEKTNPTNQPALPDEPGTRQSRFHYYAGGEVKEMEHTRVSPVLYGVWTLVAICAVAFFLVGGALGPKFGKWGAYAPTGNATSTQEELRAGLNSGGVIVNSLDINQVPRPAGQSLQEAIDAGSDVYQTNCIGCHGPNQDGNGVGASALNPKPRNLRDAPFMQAMSYQRINTSVHKGVYGTAMPRWENTLSEKQIQDVIVYVFSLTSPTAPAAAGSKPASGGTNQYNNGIQNSPKPITPPVGGSPAAPTNTAPPSTSGTGAPGVGTDVLAGGGNANQPQPLKPAAPTPGSSTPAGATGPGASSPTPNGPTGPGATR